MWSAAKYLNVYKMSCNIAPSHIDKNDYNIYLGIEHIAIECDLCLCDLRAGGFSLAGTYSTPINMTDTSLQVLVYIHDELQSSPPVRLRSLCKLLADSRDVTRIGVIFINFNAFRRDG